MDITLIFSKINSYFTEIQNYRSLCIDKMKNIMAHQSEFTLTRTYERIFQGNSVYDKDKKKHDQTCK